MKNAILTAVKDAGPNACPPMVVGVGVGGTFEKCALMAKKDTVIVTFGSLSHLEAVKQAVLNRKMQKKDFHGVV